MTNSTSKKISFKILFELSNNVFLPFVSIYFANVLQLSKSMSFILLAAVPFFSRLIRPFIYFILRPYLNLDFFNFLSIVAIIFGLALMLLNNHFLILLLGISTISIGQGIYRITLRREIANDPNNLKFSMFVFSSIIAPVLSYPIGFYTLNKWPQHGIIISALTLLVPLAILSCNFSKDSRVQKETIIWKNIINKQYFPMCIVTFFLSILVSSLNFSLPLIIYKDSTSIPMLELFAISISGVMGIIAVRIFKFTDYAALKYSIFLFIISPLCLLYGRFESSIIAISISIILISFSNGIMNPIILSIPNQRKWGGDIESRFFLHSISMALGTILNIAIATLFFYQASVIRPETTGLLFLSAIAVYSLVILKKLRDEILH